MSDYPALQEVNPVLIDCARWRVQGEHEKQAFIPPGGDPAAMGGAPPMDPAAMGGAPPMDPAAMGGAPPMDPAMAGGGMPMDPAMAGGGMPPMDPMAGGGAIDPATQAAIDAAVQAALGATGGGAAGAGAPGAAGPGKGAKIDPGMIYMELGRMRKMMTTMFQNLSWELPPDILDDQAVAQSVSGMDPASPPTDQAVAAPAPAEQPGLPAIGQTAAVNPIEPIGGGGAPKQANLLDLVSGNMPASGQEVTATTFDKSSERVDVLAMLSRSLNAA
jgi:hypothetical protein